MPNGVQQHPSFQTEPGNLLPPSQSLPLACLKRASVLYSSPQQPLAGFFFAHRIAHTTTQPSPAFTNLQFRPQTESSVASHLLYPLLPGRRGHADLSRLRPDLFESSNLIASSAFPISATPIFRDDSCRKRFVTPFWRSVGALLPAPDVQTDKPPALVKRQRDEFICPGLHEWQDDKTVQRLKEAPRGAWHETSVRQLVAQDTVLL